MINLTILLIIVFLIGFELGKKFIVKGLSERTIQLHQEGDHEQARLIEKVLKKHKSKNDN
ncbi:hypothetical protein [Cytobacillus kochii]|uniref:Uncharacterized protein n=1 Tax=Cytobacillus kochii TaxID=859143 RepID=A0A248THJ4_9BACI|nr:hypothetical protein [Cytobacillus kochii]ASV67592.1 hypothetical protein CKF48_09820 [Cytobacillus kochii]MDQ0186344.1 hypothetical protein [Cytobacillus kochii]